MRCERYRCDPARLIEAVTGEAILGLYRRAVAAELPGMADRRLMAHLRRLDRLAAEVQMGGFTQLARREPEAADALLTDLVAVATWHGWELPLEPLGAAEVDTAPVQRGLLGADAGREGATLWVLDHATIAVARNREVSEVEGGHWRV